MKRTLQGLAGILLVLSTLAGCGLSFGPLPRDVAGAFDRLAHYVPANAEFPLFFDLKPEGDVAIHWDRLRARLEADGSGQQLLNLVFGVSGPTDSLLGQFKAESLGLMDAIAGPAVAGRWQSVQYAILEVSDERQAREALIANLGDESAWEQESFDGHTLHYGQFIDGSGETLHLAWTIVDGMVFLVYNTSTVWFHNLEALLSVPAEDTLAEQPNWPLLHGRLPEGLIAVSGIVLGPGAAGSPPPSTDDDPLSALTYYLDAVMLAAVPEAGGMRIYLDGAFAPGVADVPAFQSLFALPPVDAGAWTTLPADTALALVSHDLATVWPWMRELFSGQDLVDAFGAGLVDPLVAPGGPLSGAFAAAIRPPFPTQPVLSGVPALQFLAVSPDTEPAQAEALGAALESKGAVLGDDTVEGVAIRRQVGTEASGYAPAYGFDDGLFYFGSSPQAIGQGIVARRENNGLVTQPAYQVFLGALPEKAFCAGYVNGDRFLEIVQDNTPAEQTVDESLAAAMTALDGIGFGLALTPERLDGVLYLVILE